MMNVPRRVRDDGTPAAFEESLTAILEQVTRDRIRHDGIVDYVRYRRSRSRRMFSDWLADAETADIRPIGTGDRARAFWINLYNLAVLQNVIEHGPPTSYLARRTFFTKPFVSFGELEFSLDDVEHGVLRGNRRAPHRLRRPFRDAGRKQLVLELDPRIHFTLSCSATDCPDIHHYDPDQLERQLSRAAEYYIEHEVHLRPNGELSVPKIFLWYKGAFEPGVSEFISRHADDPEIARAARSADVSIVFRPYDWTLNGVYE